MNHPIVEVVTELNARLTQIDEALDRISDASVLPFADREADALLNELKLIEATLDVAVLISVTQLQRWGL